MTNEIENFMRAYGVEKTVECNSSWWCGKDTWHRDNTQKSGKCAYYLDGVGCKNKGMTYPSITPSRILELMRFLLQKGSFQIDQLFADKYEIYYCTNGAKSEFVSRGSTVDLCVLNLLTSLRPELSDDEVEKVRQVFKEG